MLVDNPNSQGLKDKLTKVRAMAAEASPEAGKVSPVPSLDVPEAFSTGLGTGGAAPGPGVEEWETPPLSSPEAARQPKHFDTGFEPKEYVPPDAAPRQPAGRAAEKVPAEKSVYATRKPAVAGRKETIDRLEGWLKNIKKEK